MPEKRNGYEEKWASRKNFGNLLIALSLYAFVLALITFVVAPKYQVNDSDIIMVTEHYSSLRRVTGGLFAGDYVNLYTTENNMYLINWDNSFTDSEFAKEVPKYRSVTIGYIRWWGKKPVCYLEWDGKIYRSIESSLQYYDKIYHGTYSDSSIATIAGIILAIFATFVKIHSRKMLKAGHPSG